MKTRELRERTREELYKLRAQRAVSQIEKSHRIMEVRRTIARVVTILKDGGYSHA